MKSPDAESNLHPKTLLLFVARFERALGGLEAPATPLAAGPITSEALNQIRTLTTRCKLSARLASSFQHVHRTLPSNEDGSFRCRWLPAIVFAPEQDPLLARTLACAKQSLSGATAGQRATVLCIIAKRLLTPLDLRTASHSFPDPEKELTERCRQFNVAHHGQRVLLGEYLRRRQGACIHQSILVKAMADCFNDMQCTLVVGTAHAGFLARGHAWTEIAIDGTAPRLYDPRSLILGKRVPPSANRNSPPELILMPGQPLSA
jgi:hypothetical protein